MNKGRNIALLLGAMLCVSILTFLVRMNMDNWQGVYDGVRYVRGDTVDDKTEYEFFFIERETLKADLEYIGDNEYRLVFQDYEYDYRIVGTGRKDAKVSGQGKYDILETQAFDLISERLFIYMVFGKPAVLTVPKAILIFCLVISGAAVILKAEELWYIVGRHDKSLIPKWGDLTIYKVAGGAICGLALILLIIFLIV